MEYRVTAVNGNGEGAPSQIVNTDPAAWRNWDPQPGEDFTLSDGKSMPNHRWYQKAEAQVRNAKEPAARKARIVAEKLLRCCRKFTSGLRTRGMSFNTNSLSGWCKTSV